MQLLVGILRTVHMHSKPYKNRSVFSLCVRKSDLDLKGQLGVYQTDQKKNPRLRRQHVQKHEIRKYMLLRV